MSPLLIFSIYDLHVILVMFMINWVGYPAEVNVLEEVHSALPFLSESPLCLKPAGVTTARVEVLY